MSIWKTIKGYIWWTYPRGSLHYDVMVTLILLFIFVTPYWVNFGDKPPGPPAHPTAVLVQPDGASRFVYQIDAAAIDAADDHGVRQQLRRVIEPVSGSIVIDRYEKAAVEGGRTVYKVWTHR